MRAKLAAETVLAHVAHGLGGFRPLFVIKSVRNYLLLIAKASIFNSRLLILFALTLAIKPDLR